ncbi:MAG TPA: carboxypeptidase-like regulatory domain-containing protein, partial [Candidatus Paceibacterota bacterium]
GEKPSLGTLAEIPKITPKAFSFIWNILPVKAINSFVFAPLPYDIRILASKFPELDKTLKSVGIERLSDLGKLTGVSLNIPGLANILDKTITTVGLENLSEIDKLNGVSINIPGLSNLDGQMMNNVGVGKIALIKGLPIAKFSPSAKKNLPAEFVFARANQELVDLNVALSVGQRGEVSQQMSTLPGQTLRLVVKPISKASSVTGYFVFKAPTPKVSTNSIPRSSLTASALFSMNDFVEQVPTSPPTPLHSNEEGEISFSGTPGKVQDGAIAENIEHKLVLSSFEYTDPDHDGIYTADVVSPVVPGEYEIITVINYIDPVLGTRQMRMTTVIDPEGYVFEKNGAKETRIPSAIVSLYHLNTTTKKYELWPAKDYQQENPQVTDVRGTYSFLVPEGSYYFEVEAPGYLTHRGKVFVVAEGSGIHQNIELGSSTKWMEKIDFQTVLLIVVLLLLMYNFYRNTLREKLLRFLNKNDGK